MGTAAGKVSAGTEMKRTQQGAKPCPVKLRLPSSHAVFFAFTFLEHPAAVVVMVSVINVPMALNHVGYPIYDCFQVGGSVRGPEGG